MDAHVQDCVVEGYRSLISSLELPDPNDRHVLAAAIRAHASVIVTFNRNLIAIQYVQLWKNKCSMTRYPGFTSTRVRFGPEHMEELASYVLEQRIDPPPTGRRSSQPTPQSREP